MTRVRLLASAVMMTALASCQSAGPPGISGAPEPSLDTMTFAPVVEVDLSKFTRTKSGAYFRDVVPGTGAVAATERTIAVKYVISLPSGTIVETQNTPMSLTIGPDLIRGLREGLPGMKAGGTRRIVVPPALGYGRAAHGGIPPQSTLIFDVELVSVR